MGYLALYGNVGIPRTFCKDCQSNTFVIGGVKQCCSQPEEDEITGTKRVFQADGHKHQPSMAEKQRILRQQNNHCLYCGRRLGSLAWYKGRQIVLRVNWDHILPFEYSRSNHPENYVAACHVCNRWKSDLVFTYLEEIQVYVSERWQRVETDVGKNLPSMRNQVPD